MKRTKIIIVISTVLILGLGAAENRKIYSVNDLVAQLLILNPSLQIQNRTEAMDAESYRLEKRLPNPLFSAAAGSAMPIDATESERRIWDLGLEWTLPNPLTRSHELQGRRWEVRAAASMRLEEHWQQIHAFKARLYNLLRLESQHTTQEQMIVDLERIAAIIDSQIAVGESKRLDALWARSNLTLAKTRLHEISALITACRQQIHADLAGTLPLDFAVADEANSLPKVPTLPELEEKLQRNPALEGRRAQLATSDSQLRAVRSGWLPDLGLHIERAREVDASVWKGGVTIEIPLFTGNLSRLPLMRYQRERAELEVRRQELQDRTMLVSLLAEMDALVAALAGLENEELSAGQEAMRLAELGLKSGELSFLNYLEIRKIWHELNLKRPELVARLQTVNSALESLIGGW